jgi:phosphoribosylanthranilate isomerase
MTTWVKTCCMTNVEDALEAASLGVDALGFVFAPSPRRVEPPAAKEIIRRLPPGVLKVGVFVNEAPEEVRRVIDYCGLNMVQFHGEESPAYCRQMPVPVIKTLRVRSRESLQEMERYAFATILLDAWDPQKAGGTGEPFCWQWVLEARPKRNFILSGGLSPGNVFRAIRQLRPSGVDVCSGVERTPGKKEKAKMHEFIKEVQKADASTR